MKVAFAMEYDEDSQVYVTHVPALGGISTYGDTEEEAIARTREMVEGWFEALEKHLPESADTRADRDRKRTKLLELELAVG